MTLLLIIGAAIFTLVAAYHAVTPFLSSRQDQLRFEVLDEDLRRVEELAARKSNLLKSLRDVEFDFETDKISESDYRELKQRYERQAVEVMRDLDEVHGGRGWEKTIDEELGRRLIRIKEKRQTARGSDATSQSATSSAASAAVCPDCSKEMETNARFCSQCGATMVDETDEPASHEPASNEAADKQAPLESHTLPTSGSEVAT
jgi:cytochrome c-type biogenesis protein CcmH/NrfG